MSTWTEVLTATKGTEAMVFGPILLLGCEEAARVVVGGCWAVDVWVLVDGARRHVHHGAFLEKPLIKIGVFCPLTRRHFAMLR